MVDLQKPCVKCGAVDRNASGKCKPCRKAADKTYRQSSEVRASRRAIQRKYRNNPESLARIKAYMRKYDQSAYVRERKRASDAKKKRLDFEFSLQTQQKVIEQCQQKST